MARNRNSLVINGARAAMEQFKVEIASELGLTNYEYIDKGELTSRQNGYVGGNMTRKMVAFAEAEMASRGAAAVAQAGRTDAPQNILAQNQTSNAGGQAFMAQGFGGTNQQGTSLH